MEPFGTTPEERAEFAKADREFLAQKKQDDDLHGLAAREAMNPLFDIEPEEITPRPPHYWHETFQSYGEASSVDALPNVFVIVRIYHTLTGYAREAFGITATRAEATKIVERFRPLEPGSQWDIDEYVPLPF